MNKRITLPISKEGKKAPGDEERLKNLLFDFVKRVSTQPSTAKETEMLPRMTALLIKLIRR